MQVNYSSYEYTATSAKFSVQTGASQSAKPRKEEGKDAASVQKQDAYVPSKEAMDASQRAALIDSMKASLQSSQQKLFDQVNQLLSQQGMTMRVGEGAWKVFAEGNFQVDAETKAAAQQAISEDGEWGVKKTSERLITFAKALVGGDRGKVDLMRDAFIKGYKAAEKAWGGCLPGIAKETYDATMKLFDEWENGDSEQAEESAAAPEEAPSTSGLSFNFSYSRVEASYSSYEASYSSYEADSLERSGVLYDISDPIRMNGLNLKSAWCMNERVSVSFTIGNSSSNAPVKPGQDGFVHRDSMRHDNGFHHGNQNGRKVTVDFIKPLQTGGGKTVKVGGQEIPTHEDGTVTVALSDGTLRRARVNQEALDRATRNHGH